VVVSSDLNPRYLDAWDLTRRMWSEVGGVRPHLVLVAPATDMPPALAIDPLVHVFEPIPGLHTALQAQCIRLLYPALLDTEGAVLISDVDMFPLSRRYFHVPIERVDERHFVAYRDVLLPGAQIPICYNAALPAVWANVFDVRSPGDVRERLSQWGEGLVYEGTHGGQGWLTDQLILYRTLIERSRAHGDVWILRDEFTGFERLARRNGQLADSERDRIRRNRYADFHVVTPYEEHQALNHEVMQLAIGSAAAAAAS
jgi:hypothetical protein